MYVRSQAMKWPTRSRRPLTAEVRLRYEVGVCGICGGQCGTRTRDFPRTYGFPVNIIPPMFHAHLHLHVALTRRTNGSNL